MYKEQELKGFSCLAWTFKQCLQLVLNVQKMSINDSFLELALRE